MSIQPRERQPALGEAAIAIGIIWAFDLAVFAGAALLAMREPDKPDVVPWLIGALVQWAWAMAVCGFVVCRRHRLGFREGFAVRPVPLATLVWNAATGILAASAATALVLHFAPKEPATAQAAVTPAATVLFCVMMLTVPVAEELYYRGFVYGVLARRLRPVFAIPLIAFWFGLAHLAQTQGLLALVPFPFIMGAVLAWFRHRSGSATASFACHWAYNATLVAAALGGLGG